jgi:hypothetical protein
MKTLYAASALAIILAAGAAQAQTTIVTQPVQTETVVTTRQPLVLTPVQRKTIYRTIARVPVAAPAVTVGQAPVVEYRVGARVPPTATLYPVPQDVAVEVPAVQNYRYMVINNRAWLVDPATSEIVAEVDE